MVAVPSATPVMTPEAELTVAIAVSEEEKVPPATVESKSVVPVPQMLCEPLSAPGLHPTQPEIVKMKVQVVKFPLVSVTVIVIVSGPFPNVLNKVPGAGL